MNETNTASGRIVYRFKEGARIKADPQVAGEMCARLEREGGLTPARLLDENRPTEAPLHGCFEWNDSKAAEAHRREQAAHIIRSVVVVEVAPQGKADPVSLLVNAAEPVPTRLAEPVRAFVSVGDGGPDSSGRYEPIQNCLTDPDKQAELMRQARAELAAFVRKYRNLQKLAGVVSYLENALQLDMWNASAAQLPPGAAPRWASPFNHATHPANA